MGVTCTPKPQLVSGKAGGLSPGCLPAGDAEHSQTWPGALPSQGGPGKRCCLCTVRMGLLGERSPHPPAVHVRKGGPERPVDCNSIKTNKVLLNYRGKQRGRSVGTSSSESPRSSQSPTGLKPGVQLCASDSCPLHQIFSTGIPRSTSVLPLRETNRVTLPQIWASPLAPSLLPEEERGPR